MCQKKVGFCDEDECQNCYDRSFASHPKSKYWSDQNEIKPRFAAKNSHSKYYFDCKCGHIFSSILKNINIGETWCPYCCNPGLKLCDDENCESCFNKSFASHPKSKFWSPQNELSARSVLKNSGKKFIFDCQCNHTFGTSPNDVSSGYWCPYCCFPPLRLCEDINCMQCYFNSFFSHPKSLFWSKQNELEPRFVFKNCHTPFIFVCENKHIFSCQLNNISSGNTWCPFCKYKTEAKLHKWLDDNYLSVEYQKKYPWCKKVNELPFDFVLEDMKIIIELDGEQHFRQVAKWKSPEVTQKTDILKMKQALKHGYSVIRILQQDVWNDNYDWENVLTQHIKKYKNPTCIYLSDGNEYDNYKSELS